MGNAEGQNSAAYQLYPVRQPFNFQMLSVSGGHTLYVEECGNPDGIPVVVLHGGPGGGCSPNMRRFFHPDIYRAILFDQRGCGRSRPHASVENNTTWDLVADIELIRTTLNIEKWIVFGGSWGATLALIYAQAHLTSVSNLVLRGPFLMTQNELDWFYGGGAGKIFPEHWQALIGFLPEAEQNDVIAGYHRRLFGNDPDIQTEFARAWTSWENALASMKSAQFSGSAPAAYALAFARLENHYFTNRGFLEHDGQIFTDMPKIQHIPGTIVQGRFDMICPTEGAHKLHQAWPASRLIIVPDAGHSLSEPGISSALVRAMDEMS